MKARTGSEPRVRRVRLLRIALLVLAAAAAGGLAAAWTFGERGLAWFEGRALRARVRLGKALQERHAVAFYAPLDERVPADAVTGHPLRGTAAVRVPGVVGSARRFDGRPGQNLVGNPRWSPFSRTGVTVAFWARFPEGAADVERRLVWDHDRSGDFGVRLRNGRLEAVLVAADGPHVLSAPAPEPGRFVHVAFVLGTRRAFLLVDGAERDSCDVAGPYFLPPHGMAVGTDGHFPPAFDIDDWCVWRGGTPLADIARLASSRRAVSDLFEPELAARARRCTEQAAAFRSFLGVLGAFRPARVSPAVFNRKIPALELRLSRADRRHFRKAQLEALSSGFRTDEGAEPRRVQASLGGRTERIRAWLDETVPRAPSAARPAFVLASETGLFGKGSGLARLFPPEQFGVRRPDAARPLPLDPSSLVRLHLDGDFLGLYCLVPFEGPSPPWFATGLREVSRPDRIHFSAPAAGAAAGAGMSGAERDRAWNRMLALLRTDPNFPLGPAEAAALARDHVQAREALLFANPEPGPEDLLGDNPAAFYVTDDLDLDAAGPGLAWRSSDPSAISAKGRVRRPEDGRPRVVELSADLPDGGTRTHRFRVMPRAPGLPALFLSFGRPLDKLSRTDFVCLRVPAGEDPEPVWLHGTGPGGGGAKLRGNTSYATGSRRSINLEFDEPLELPGLPRPVRHLLLLSGYADPTRLRNALSFDVFEAMSPPDTVRATPVFWTEVFVNGAWAGVWECCPRLQDAVSEDFSALYKVRSPHGLWTDPDASAESVDRVGPAEPDPYGPFRELVRFVVSSDAAAFAAGLEETFDLGELADFFLLVNFTGNEDGRVTNQFAGRRGEDGRWLLLPWDYDKTFLVPPAGVSARTELLVSPLFARIFGTVPSFRPRLAARWRELRAGPLSEKSLDAWIDERAAVLAPSMEEDYRLVPPLGHDGDFAAAVAALRAEVRDRLSRVDRFLGPAGPALRR